MRLRRPCLVETAPLAGAARLRSRDTQDWIATFGVGKYDDQPLFDPDCVVHRSYMTTVPQRSCAQAREGMQLVALGRRNRRCVRCSSAQ